MDLKKLEYLETIYRLRSFSKAAEAHFISQPSISNAIQKLETELGVLLIDRNAKPLVFTPEGVRFMSHVYTILNAVEEAQKDMREISSLNRQQLKMAIHSTLGDWILTQIFSDFQERYPGYEVLIMENTSQIMLEELLAEEIDLAYTLIPDNCDLEVFETIPIQNCELYALLPKGHPLEHYTRIPLGMLKPERLLTFPPGSLIYSRLESAFQQLKIVPKFQTLHQIRIIQNLVEQGRGISFVTIDELSFLEDTSTFSVRPFQEPIYFLKGFILKRNKKRTNGVNSMISYVQATIQKKRQQKGDS